MESLAPVEIAVRRLKTFLIKDLASCARECGFDSATAPLSYWFRVDAVDCFGVSLEADTVRVMERPQPSSVVLEVSGQTLVTLVNHPARLLELFGAGAIQVRGDLTRVQPMVRVIGTMASAKTSGPVVTRRMRDALVAASAATPRLMEIPRRAGLSREEFNRQHGGTGLPVILTDALEDWALRAWSPEALGRAFGETVVVYRRGREVEMQSSTLADYLVAIAREDCDPDAVLYVDNDKVPDGIRPLLGAIRFFTEDDLDRTGAWVPNAQGFFFGPRGTVTRLHWDMADNFLAQVWGSKRITLLPPADSRWVYLQFDRESANEPDDKVAPHLRASVDPAAPDWQQYPLYRNAVPIECSLNPGECIYIPAGWLHRVESLSPSLSVSHLLCGRLPKSLSGLSVTEPAA